MRSRGIGVGCLAKGDFEALSQVLVGTLGAAQPHAFFGEALADRALSLAAFGNAVIRGIPFALFEGKPLLALADLGNATAALLFAGKRKACLMPLAGLAAALVLALDFQHFGADGVHATVMGALGKALQVFFARELGIATPRRLARADGSQICRFEAQNPHNGSCRQGPPESAQRSKSAIAVNC